MVICHYIGADYQELSSEKNSMNDIALLAIGAAFGMTTSLAGALFASWLNYRFRRSEREYEAIEKKQKKVRRHLAIPAQQLIDKVIIEDPKLAERVLPSRIESGEKFSKGSSGNFHPDNIISQNDSLRKLRDTKLLLKMHLSVIQAEHDIAEYLKRLHEIEGKGETIE